MTTFGEWRRGEGERIEAEALTIPEAARGFQGERAGFPSRVAACSIDMGLVILAMFALWLVVLLIQLIFTPGINVEPPRVATLVLIGYVFMVLYWAVSWGATGRSLGSWFMGLRVVNRRGGKLSWSLALLRAAFCVSFPFGLIWALFSKRNRSLQDLVLRTIVIYDWTVKPLSIPGFAGPSED